MTRQLAERLHLDRLPDGIRNALDSWRFWFTMGGIAIGGLIVVAAVNTLAISNTQAKQTKDDAIKAAQIQAAAQSAYSACLNSRPELAKLSNFVVGVNEIADALLENSASVLVVTAPGDPQYDARVGNFARLDKAALKVRAIKQLPVPTRAECNARKASILTEATNTKRRTP